LTKKGIPIETDKIVKITDMLSPIKENILSTKPDIPVAVDVAKSLKVIFSKLNVKVC